MYRIALASVTLAAAAFALPTVAAESVGQAASDAATKTGHAVGEAGRKTGHAVKKGGRKVKAATTAASEAK